MKIAIEQAIEPLLKTENISVSQIHKCHLPHVREFKSSLPFNSIVVEPISADDGEDGIHK